MRLVEIVAQHIYENDGGNAPFSSCNSDTRDIYFRKATQELPQLLAGYFSYRGRATREIRGAIRSFIAAHSTVLTHENQESLARRIKSALCHMNHEPKNAKDRGEGPQR